MSQSAPQNGLRLTCWGTRGSIPSPGPGTVRFGGNTPCLEVEAGPGRRCVLDAGSGLRALGDRLRGEPGPVDLDLFLTHFHWDHIQGFPFFRPLHDEDCRVRVHGPRQEGVDIESLLRVQMAPEYFPVPYATVAATLAFHHTGPGAWTDGHLEVAAYRLRHAGHTCGYRVRAGGAAVAYLPDNELVGGAYPVDGPGWYDGLIEFLRGVDVLLHDAMYTDDEYARAEGWGHSTFAQAARLAEDAGVGHLLFFHHAPDRSDAELLRILEAVREDGARRGSPLRLDLAEEGWTLEVPGRTVLAPDPPSSGSGR